MRLFPSHHPAVSGLVTEVGCHLVPVKLEDGDNLFYRKGERHRKKDFVLSDGRSIAQLVRDCLDNYKLAMPEDAALDPYQSTELVSLSLPEFLRKYGASEEDVEEFV